MLSQPLPDLAAWTRHGLAQPLPIQTRTAEALAVLEAEEEARGSVDAHRLRGPIADDPLMALRLFAQVARLARGGIERRGAPETVTAALVLMGIGPFFRSVRGLPTVEDTLAGRPAALEGLRRVLRRAERAATFAQGFAVHRMDGDVETLSLAARLHDFAEMLLWCEAPALAGEIAARQAADPALRSAAVQREVLGITLAEWEQALMRAWELPPLLIRMTDDRQARDPQVRCVSLAVRLARHSQDGWDNPALPDDFSELGELLLLGPEAVRERVHDLDA